MSSLTRGVRSAPGEGSRALNRDATRCGSLHVAGCGVKANSHTERHVSISLLYSLDLIALQKHVMCCHLPTAAASTSYHDMTCVSPEEDKRTHERCAGFSDSIFSVAVVTDTTSVLRVRQEVKYGLVCVE